MKNITKLLEEKKISEALIYLVKNKKNFSERDYTFYSALIMQLEGKISQAEEEYKKIIKINDNDLSASINLSVIYNEKREHNKSLKLLFKFIDNNNTLQYHIALFDAYFGLKKYDIAESIISKLMDKKKDDLSIIERYAVLKIDTNQIDEAISILSKIESDGKNSKRLSIYTNLIAAYNKKEDFESAALYCNKSENIFPKSWQYILNKSTCLMGLDKNKDAEELLQSININTIEKMIGLAKIDLLNGNIESSIEKSLEGLQLDSNNISLLCIMADCYSLIGIKDKAEHYYKRCLELNQNDYLVNWHHSLSLLRNKEFKAGWKKYEWGFKQKRKGRGEYLFKQIEEWNGDGNIDKLIVWGEQGIGDILMFSKFIKYIPNSVKNIELRIDKRLVESFRKNFMSNRNIIISPFFVTNNIPHIPIGNLPNLFWEDFELDANGKKPFFLKYESNTNLPVRVGITWRGGNSERLQYKRSVPLSIFKNLNHLKSENIQIVMLQYNALPNEIEYLKLLFNNISLPKYNPLIEVDAWIQHISSCDLVLSVDNSAIHYSSAMGIQTLAMIPKYPDFRWCNSIETNCWYESLTLIEIDYQINKLKFINRISKWLENKLSSIRK